MKIEHEILSVQVVRNRTIAQAVDAFRVAIGKHLLSIPSKNILDTRHREREDRKVLELAEILQEPLRKEYEDASDQTYIRTCALVSLDRQMERREVYQELSGRGYCPASISEGMSYVPILKKDGVEVDIILHLGTFLCNEKYIEQRLISKKDGSIELIPFFPATILKPHYHIVAVKEEKKPQKK